MTSSIRPLSRLRSLTQAQTHSALHPRPSLSPRIHPATAHFHTSRPQHDGPDAKPPSGFRLPRPKRFYEGESALDKASNYFLLTEMFRGMYVVLEQYFRPP